MLQVSAAFYLRFSFTIKNGFTPPRCALSQRIVEQGFYVMRSNVNEMPA